MYEAAHSRLSKYKFCACPLPTVPAVADNICCHILLYGFPCCDRLYLLRLANKFGSFNSKSEKGGFEETLRPGFWKILLDFHSLPPVTNNICFQSAFIHYLQINFQEVKGGFEEKERL